MVAFLIPQFRRVVVSTLLLALSLSVPSAGVIKRRIGTIGVLVYAAAVTAAIIVAHRYALGRILASLTTRTATWLLVGTFVLLLAFVRAMYPIANTSEPGRGSDRDDALNLAATELLHGRYPYYSRTYLGNPVSPMPGSLLLAVPFVAASNEGYQNLFWLLAFVVAVSIRANDRRLGLLLLWTVLALAPVVINELATGGDLLANAIFVTVPVMCLADAVPDTHDGRRAIRPVLLAVLTGIGLSSRAPFLLVLPPLLAFLRRKAGLRAAATYMAIVVFVFGAVTVPFYLHAPQAFSPMHTVSKLDRQIALPHAGLLLAVLSAVAAVIVAARRPAATVANLLTQCAILLALPVIAACALQSVVDARLHFDLAAYGLSFLFLAAVPAFERLTRAIPTQSDNPPTVH